MDCTFCRVVDGAKAFKVREGDDYMAILDIKPAIGGHTIVFPKKHYKNNGTTKCFTNSALH